MYSNIEFFEIYYQTYPLNTYANILDIFWKVHDIETTQKSNNDYDDYNNDYCNSTNISSKRRQIFLKLFIEKFDYTQLVINSDKYSIIVNYIIGTIIHIKPMDLNYHKILKLKPNLNNDDFIFEFIKIKLTCNSINNNKTNELYNLLIDKFYERTLCEISYIYGKM